MIALATVLLGVLLFTLYLHAFEADLRGNDKEAYRRLAWTTPPWFAVTLINAAQADVLFFVINVAMTMSGVWAWAEYRVCVAADKAAAEWVDEHEQEIVEVLDSRRGGEQ